MQYSQYKKQTNKQKLKHLVKITGIMVNRFSRDLMGWGGVGRAQLRGSSQSSYEDKGWGGFGKKFPLKSILSLQFSAYFTFGKSEKFDLSSAADTHVERIHIQ